jgi:YD repeat-containing protein
MKIISIRLGRQYTAKLIVLLLTTLLIIAPVVPAFADTLGGASSIPTATETPIIRPALDTAGVTPTKGSILSNVPPTTADITPDTTNTLVDVNATDATSSKKVATESAPDTVQSGINSLIPGQPSSSLLSKQIIPEPDLSTGALVYSYPIAVPPGRNGLQPNLSLQYNSQDQTQDGAFGYGWSASIPYIQRVNKIGTEQLYTASYFSSSLSGDLVSVSGTTYAPRIENGDFLKYTFTGNAWTVTDKKGTVYTFGSQAATRQDNPANPTQVYRWMLDKIQDTNGNFISYTYFKDSGQIYPNTVGYTGNGANTGIFEVAFLRQSRIDSVQSYAPAFPVTTSYKVNEIDVKTSGTITRKYVLAYVVGDNSTRSILRTITESGTDEPTATTTTLPPVTFTHKTNTVTGWSFSSTWSLPQNVNFDGSFAFGDINGDGFPDLLESYSGANSQITKQTWLNNGDGTWTTSSAWLAPLIFVSYSPSQINYGVIAQDVNGDGLADLLNGRTGEVYINNGSGWTLTAAWSMPLHLLTNVWTDSGARMADLNGDGLVDLFYANTDIQGNVISNVYLNTGTGWGTDVGANWVFPLPSGDSCTFVDINGDGITDIVRVYRDGRNGVETKNAWVGTGSGQFVASTAYTPTMSLSFFGQSSPSDLGIRYVDVNSDGLTDMIQAVTWLGTPYKATYLNTGTGWSLNPTWNASITFTDGLNTTSTPLDIDGNGTSDIVGNTAGIYLNDASKPDVLSNIAYPQGGLVAITYKPSTQYRNNPNQLLNPVLPFVTQTICQVTSDDGSGNQVPTTYSYAGGHYYYNAGSPIDRRFAGFAIVTETDGAGNTTKSYFHQANGANGALGEYNDDFWKIGKVYRIEVANTLGNLYSKIINRWDDIDLGNTKRFVKLTQTLTQSYDGLTTHKDSAEGYIYNNTTGNLTQKIEYGQVTGNDDGSFTDIGTDRFTTTYTYAAGGAVIGLPGSISTVNQSSSKIKESKYFYDGQGFGQVTKGNLTEQDEWISGTRYAVTKKYYDGTFGLVIQVTDPNNRSTNYAYDSTRLYPVTVTDALSYSISYIYDYSSGQIRQKTDPNNLTSQYKYDGLDRLIESDQPDLTTPSMLVTRATYIYTDTSGEISLQETDYLDANHTSSTSTYFDGLNRKIQKRKTEADLNYLVKDYIYDNVGLLQQESLPYFGSGNAKTSPTTTDTLYISYTYDPLRRVATTTNAVGVTTNIYANWKSTLTDANGKTKDTTIDAYGNLVEVVEHNQGSTYTTKYTYNYLGNLLKITDASGNVRNFTYDGLGRRLTAQDLHAPTDTTFGTWTYGYDDAGNLKSRLDPNGKTTSYTYDAINRVLTEAVSGQTGNRVTYTYDACPNGIGYLCQVVTDSVTTTYTYNAIGLLSSETKTIAMTGYTTVYTYNRQGSQLTITNPDNSQVQYAYDQGGLIVQVRRKENTDSGFTDVISNITYSPTEQPMVTTYANGVITTNTYDATELYRFKGKLTTSGVGSSSNPPSTPPVSGPSSSWSQITFPTTKIRSVAVDPTNSDIIYVGTYDHGLYKSTDRGQNWTQLTTDLGSNWPILSIAINSSSTSTIYITKGSFNGNSFFMAKVYKSTNGGSNWNDVSNGLSTSGDLSNLVIDPGTPSTLYVISSAGGVYKSTNSGSSWSQIYNSSSVNSFSLSPSTTSIMYFSTWTAVYKSTNGGSTWTNVFSLGYTVFQVAVDPVTPSTVYASTIPSNIRIFKSTDSGANWSQTTNQVPQGSDPATLLINPISHSDLYVLTGPKVYHSSDSGNNWADMSSGIFSSNFSRALAIDTNLAVLYLAHDNGLYRYVVGNTSQAPVINSFGAGPSWILSGHSTTLYWTMSGGTPTSLSIDQGIGSVFNSGSVTVSPTTQTTYTLTASNSIGTATAQVTVTTNPPQLQNLLYAYDKVGNIIQITDNSTTNTKKTVIYGYDDLYRLTSATATNVAAGQQTYSKGYTYDPLGNILTHTQSIGSNSPVMYTYSYQGNLGSSYANLHAVTSISNGTSTTNYNYDKGGNLLAASTGTINTFDYNNRMVQSRVGSGPSTVTIT